MQRLDEFCGLDPARRSYHRIPKTLQVRNEGWKKCVTQQEFSALQDVCGPLDIELGYRDSLTECQNIEPGSTSKDNSICVE